MRGFVVGGGSDSAETKELKAAIEAETKARKAADDELSKRIGEFSETDTGAFAERLNAAEKRLDAITAIVADEHDSWANISALVRSGSGPAAFAIGDQLITPWKNGDTSYDAPQNVCHFSKNEIFSDDNGQTETPGNGMFLLWHYATPYDMPFDTRKALYAAPEGGLPKGTYYFTVTGIVSSWGCYANNNGKTFMFELTDDLTEGQQLMLSAAHSTADWNGTYIRVYDSPYDTAFNTAYGTNGNMPLSLWDNESGSPLSGNTSANSTNGSGELNHIQVVLLGHNRWLYAAIRKWLNSAAPARKAEDPENYPGWWTPEDKYDRIPSQAYTYPGFLSGYDEDFIAAMRPVKITTACNTVTDGGVTDVTYDKVFLPSLTNMNIAPQVAEGEIWDYYKQLFAANPVDDRTNWVQNGTYAILKSYGISAKTTAVNVRLRSARRDYASNTWFITASGTVAHIDASNAFRQRPACVIG
ncbi:MAG: hypothetical protein J1G06_09925 [Oscillospiraceae bacterium]|nr:hypothetical protein [Oscillospiraceae bacterium]